MSASVTPPVPKPQYRLLRPYYSRADYFRHDINKGSIRTPTGERICALTADFLLGFHKAVEFECGKSTGQVFKSAGKRWGRQFVERFEKDLTNYFRTPIKDMGTALVYDCLAEAFRAHGWGKLLLNLDEMEHGFIVVEIQNSVVPSILAGHKGPNDHLMTGFLASFFSHFAEQELDAAQTACTSLGAASSLFVVGLMTRLEPIAEWVSEGLSHADIMNRLKGFAS